MPEVVIHQMTAISDLSNLRRFDQLFASTNALRTAGVDHLLAAAIDSGARRLLVQSYTGWPNDRHPERSVAAIGGGPTRPRTDSRDLATEDEPLAAHPPAAQQRSLQAIRHLETVVSTSTGIEGLALRYGSLYGPGASELFSDGVRRRRLPLVGRGQGVWSFLHVDDAASATVAALTRGAAGVYNVCDDDPAPVAEWLPYLADQLGANRPRRVPVWAARAIGGEVAVSMMTEIRGSSNAKARREFGWAPRWSSWRVGFREGLSDTPVPPA